jgi:2-oxoisovalerate dehydrogenase E1 component
MGVESIRAKLHPNNGIGRAVTPCEHLPWHERRAIMAHPMKRPLADVTLADRVPMVDQRFRDVVGRLEATAAGDREARLHPRTRLRGAQAVELFEDQVLSRHIDYAARALKQRGEGFYTIGSAGHEGNAALAAALRPTDPALLHYRSGAFFLTRARQAGLEDAALHMVLGMTAAADEPIAGGRHKVFGSASLWIPPQTSTIASHLPKAVGMAFAFERAKRLALPLELPNDAVVVCSFGDASVNHSTAAGALNAASWAVHGGAPLPLLFVCEDNGLGISVPTPASWVAAACGARPHIRYLEADGLDVGACYEAACLAVDHVRYQRRPAFLHLHMVRLLGHAGSDIEPLYRPLADIEAAEARDPLLTSARLLVEAGLMTPDEILERYESLRNHVAQLAADASRRPKLVSAAEVAAPLAPRDDEAIEREATRSWDRPARAAFWGGKLPEDERPSPLGVLLNRALGDLLLRYPGMLLFGEDVGHKGGVYGVTRDLAARARRGRVFDTLLDEQTILGTAIGAGHLGLLPFPELQYLAYLHNAEDQLRGEAASLQFFSQGQFRNPMVVRIAAYGYQKGFGGHFHNDNSVAVLRDIPGLVIASPARGGDAVAMLQTCAAAAATCGSVVVFLEPIALYGTRDLHDKGDGAWCESYTPSPHHVPLGSARIYHPSARDLLLVSFANGLWMSLRVARRLATDHGIQCRVLDLRWLSPLPAAELLEHAGDIGKVLVVDETRKSGGVSEAVMSALVDGGYRGALRRVASLDCFVPLGDAANLVLLQEEEIAAAALDMVGGGQRRAVTER